QSGHGALGNTKAQLAQLTQIHRLLQLQAVFDSQLLALRLQMQRDALGMQVHVLLGELEHLGEAVRLGQQQAERAEYQVVVVFAQLQAEARRGAFGGGQVERLGKARVGHVEIGTAQHQRVQLAAAQQLVGVEAMAATEAVEADEHGAAGDLGHASSSASSDTRSIMLRLAVPERPASTFRVPTQERGHHRAKRYSITPMLLLGSAAPGATPSSHSV